MLSLFVWWATLVCLRQVKETHLQIDALKKAGVSVIYEGRLVLLGLGLSFISSWMSSKG